MAEFNMGMVVASEGVYHAMKESSVFDREIRQCLARFSQKDWGNLSEDDVQANELALKNPDDLYLLGVYDTEKGKVNIITNRISEKPGDNGTTICFPIER